MDLCEEFPLLLKPGKGDYLNIYLVRGLLHNF